VANDALMFVKGLGGTFRAESANPDERDADDRMLWAIRLTGSAHAYNAEYFRLEIALPQAASASR
jgi:hypothetical protein